MNKISASIGKLVRVALREVWGREAYDFTQWLRENIEFLNDALGMSFDQLRARKAEIQQVLGGELIWRRLPSLVRNMSYTRGVR